MTPAAHTRRVHRLAGRRGGRGASRQAARRSWAPDRARLSHWFARGVLACGLAVVVLLLYRAGTGLLAMPVERIAVTGKLESAQREQVEQVVQRALDGGFVNANLAELRRELGRLPWVYSANVRRRWPDTLEIQVVEQLPIARWGDAGFLNHEAVVFHTAAAERRVGLPSIYGPEGSQQQLMRQYQRLRDMLAQLELGVDTLTQDAIGQLEAGLSDGSRLQLGNTDFLLRVQRYVDLYQANMSGGGPVIAAADLRYAAGAAVTFHPAAQLAAAGRE